MGYRRFIAYVYEYRKGKKEDNCGFVKVEVRNHMCTIEPHLQVEGLAAGEVCKVYGFVRKEGLMNGILLGSCKTGLTPKFFGLMLISNCFRRARSSLDLIFCETETLSLKGISTR